MKTLDEIAEEYAEKETCYIRTPLVYTENPTEADSFKQRNDRELAMCEASFKAGYQTAMGQSSKSFDVAFQYGQDTEKSKWIPCSERLPEITQTCLILVKEPLFATRIAYAVRLDGKWKANSDDIWGSEYEEEVWFDSLVTHWLPLPEFGEETK